MGEKTRFDSERGLVLLLLVVGGYMFIESFTFGPTAGLFPRLTAGVVLVGSLLLLVKEWLPKSIRTFVVEPSELIRTSSRVSEKSQESDGTIAERTLNRPIEPSTFTGLSVSLFVIASSLFGMLWMSPLFVVVYLRWFRQTWLVTIVLAVLAFAMAYAFMTILNLPVDEGQLITISLVVGTP